MSALVGETIRADDTTGLLEVAERAYGHEEKTRGAIFTKPAVVDFMLDLVGYTVDKPLYRMRLLEPSFGGGRFVLRAVDRLIESWRQNGGEDPLELFDSIRAAELDRDTFDGFGHYLRQHLNRSGLSLADSQMLADSWLRHEDFLLADLVTANGLVDAELYMTRGVNTLPGYFRPTKDWDLLVMYRGVLIAAIELKSQIGPSFGNNFNNRTEEAVGSAVDLWTAFREGAFGRQPAPFAGWLIHVEEAPSSTRPVRVSEPHLLCFQSYATPHTCNAMTTSAVALSLRSTTPKLRSSCQPAKAGFGASAASSVIQLASNDLRWPSLLTSLRRQHCSDKAEACASNASIGS